MSGLIVRHEQPPQTDEEWKVALADYGNDLDEGFVDESDDEDGLDGGDENVLRKKERSIVNHSFPPDQSDLERSRVSGPLIHHADSSDSLDNICPGERRRSSSIYRSKSTSTAGPSGSQLRGSSERSGSFGSACSDTDVKELLNRDYKHTLGVGSTVGKPPVHVFDEDEEALSSELERQALREFYEREGWLRCPRPSKATLDARKRTIRRLGLSSTTDCAERKAVMNKYADLAKSIFQTSSGGVSILHEQHEQAYYTGDLEPLMIPTQKAACGHALLSAEENVTAIADLSKDWRFANNDVKGDFKFYASAPLRYHRYKGRPVDVGTLCIYDREPRDTFDERERDILLRLANMLVYQLATLHSEIMAKRARGMYEQTIAFLRRSLIAPLPRKADPANRTAPRPRVAKDHEKTEPSASCTQKLHTSVKVGPKDSKSAKERAELADRHLFDDAAQTVRGILACDSVAIVGLEDFQLFIRKTGTDYTGGAKDRKVDKEKVILGFTQGKPWPAGVDPIVVHVPTNPGMRILGRSGSGTYHFDQPNAGQQFSEVIRTYIKTRHFWWDREEEDAVSASLMGMMPDESKTTLMATLMTTDGTLRIAVLASWDKPPNQFGDYSRMALPFAWILGGSIMAAMSVRKMRSLEQSQISYSNLQAHELRTPLHQILAITQLLRSQMTDLADTPTTHPNNSLMTMQQIRDLLPYLDAIDTSGKTLHGIVDNILSFLDLKGKDNMLTPSTPGLLTSPSGAPESIEVMFEELIEEACEEDKRVRTARGQPQSNVETIFEIIPPLLGEQVTEDAGGALRKALSKILSNAYKFIESQGCVEIYVDDVAYRRPPEGCEDLSLTKMISIMIVDSGKGMEDSFVREKLGEPWAKEDPFATGSGLSVHLAWRIIDLMGGSMEISSTPGGGCTVKIEVPVPRRKISVPNSPEATSPESLPDHDPSHLAVHPDHFQVQRQVALLGYDLKYQDYCVWGLPRLGKVLHHSFVKLGCHVTDIEQAEVVVLDGRMEEAPPSAKERSLYHWLDKIAAEDIVILVTADHEADPEVLRREQKLGKRIRRYRKPITPTILREILFPNHARQIVADIPTPQGSVQKPINSPDQMDEHGNEIQANGQAKSKLHFDDSAIQVKRPCKITTALSGLSSLWKPKGMPVEEAVASLCLGDYFSSRRKTSLARTNSNGSSHSRDKSFSSTPTLVSAEFSDQASTSAPSATTPMDDGEPNLDQDLEVEPEPEPENIKVMVVEDNMINRKILVKILSSKLNIDVVEAEDGAVAVELFRDFTSPVIVLLDINMPKMDGYQASTEMRAIEKQTGRRRSNIIAVTALAADDEKQRGLFECGMDKWLTKPCDKPTITREVEHARKALLGEAV